MKKIIIFTLAAFTLSSCNLFFDKDTTAELSGVSTKPTITLLGESIISMKQGGSYNDAGVEASAGENEVNVEIISGEVDPNTIGFYVVTYRASNQYNWHSYAYRAVLVHDGTPYEQEDIGGDYYIGFEFNSSVEKHEKNGYWQMSDIWDEQGLEFPIVFAEDNDGTLGIAPGVHETKGRYTGTGIFKREGGVDSLIFNVEIIPLSGDPYSKEFGWRKL